MTDRSLGNHKTNWYGVVTNVNDPDQEGRVQVRIHGYMDDTTNIPDSALPWAKPLQPISSAGHNKIGKTPVGLVVGSTVSGIYQDDDRQYPIILGVISKAGNPASGTTQNGAETLLPGTNSTPLGGRPATGTPASAPNNQSGPNADITQASQNIQQQDATSPQLGGFGNYTYGPQESNDSQGNNITQAALAKTQWANNPTVSSLTNPIGSILSQLQNVDPQNLNAVLPNAINSLIQIADLNAFSSPLGQIGILGQALGGALAAISGTFGGLGGLLNAIGTGLEVAALSPIAQQALFMAIGVATNPAYNNISNTGISSSTLTTTSQGSTFFGVYNQSTQTISGSISSGPGVVTSPSGAGVVKQYLESQILTIPFQNYSWTNQWSLTNNIVTNNVTVTYANGVNQAFTFSTPVNSSSIIEGETNSGVGVVTSPSGAGVVKAYLLNFIGESPRGNYTWANDWSVQNGAVTNNLTINFDDGTVETTSFTTYVNNPANSDAQNYIINQSVDSLSSPLSNMLQTGLFSAIAFNLLCSSELGNLLNNAAQMVFGAGITPASILNSLGTVLPTLQTPIQNTLTLHLPFSCLNQGVINTALQSYAMNQAFVKMPAIGKAALAIAAVTPSPIQMNTQLAASISAIPGISASASLNLSNIFPIPPVATVGIGIGPVGASVTI